MAKREGLAQGLWNAKTGKPIRADERNAAGCRRVAFIQQLLE
jgi:hypothetical protein